MQASPAAERASGWPFPFAVSLSYNFSRKRLVNAQVAGQFRMERRHHVAALLHPHRIAVILRQHGAARAYAADDRRADEHSFHVAAVRHRDARDAAVDLAAIGVALDGDIHQAQARLRGMRHFARQQDRSGAAAEDRLVLGEALERFGQPFLDPAASAWWCFRRRE